MQMNESSENYLETILMLSQKLPVVRSINIANELEFSKPSVSVAMKKLRESGYIEMDQNGFITLTSAGLAIAEKVYDRHKTLSSFLESLGVNAEVAAEDACRIEHVISPESFAALKEYLKNREA